MRQMRRKLINNTKLTVTVLLYQFVSVYTGCKTDSVVTTRSLLKQFHYIKVNKASFFFYTGWSEITWYDQYISLSTKHSLHNIKINFENW